MAERGTSNPAKSDPAFHDNHHDKETIKTSNSNINEKTPGQKVQSQSVYNSMAEAIHPKNGDEHAQKKQLEKESSPSKKGVLFSGCQSRRKHRKERSDEIDENTDVGDVKSPNVFQRVKEEVEAVAEAIHLKRRSSLSSPSKGSPLPHQHTEETHGQSDDIDELTSVEDVKGPNVFSRMKEEVEAVVEAIHPKKDSPDEQK